MINKYASSNLSLFLTKLRKGKEQRIIYDNRRPWFWIARINNNKSFKNNKFNILIGKPRIVKDVDELTDIKSETPCNNAIIYPGTEVNRLSTPISNHSSFQFDILYHEG